MKKVKDEEVAILCIVDGNDELFLNTRNRVESLRFKERLTIQMPSSSVKTFNLKARRARIAELHNEYKKYIKDSEFVFGVEDDTLIPHNAISRLLDDYSLKPEAGLIEAVEVGRRPKGA